MKFCFKAVKIYYGNDTKKRAGQFSRKSQYGFHVTEVEVLARSWFAHACMIHYSMFLIKERLCRKRQSTKHDQKNFFVSDVNKATKPSRQFIGKMESRIHHQS